MPHATPEPSAELYLPDGFYVWSMKFTGPALPTGAAITGCGINTNASPPQEIAGDLAAAFTSNLLAFMPDDITLAEVYVRLGSTLGTGLSAVAFPAVTGASTSAPATPGVAYLVRHLSALGGRRGRGRWFVPGVLEAQVSEGGVVLASFKTSYDSGLSGFRTAMVAAGTPLAIGHRYVAGSAGPLIPPSEITLSTLDVTVASQRKRQRR